MSSTYTAPPAILGRSEAPQVTARAGASTPEIDGELVVSTNRRLDFDALQKERLVTTSPARACQLIAAIPASYVAFDLLAYGGVDLRTQRWATRRSRLEQLASDWSPPLQLTPVTYDLDEAREWFDVLPAAMGVEGLVLKPTAAWYAGGRRSSWAKVNSVGVAVFDELTSGTCDQVSNGSRGA